MSVSFTFTFTLNLNCKKIGRKQWRLFKTKRGLSLLDKLLMFNV